MPVRTCAACRTRRSQVVLVRVVRKPDGEVCLDTGRHRTAGRGAYLCADLHCIDLAEKRHALQRSFHGERIPVDIYDVIRHAVVNHDGMRHE